METEKEFKDAYKEKFEMIMKITRLNEAYENIKELAIKSIKNEDFNTALKHIGEAIDLHSALEVYSAMFGIGGIKEEK